MRKRITQQQKAMLKKHAPHHSKKHMDDMKTAMRKGKTFTEAHKKAKKIGT
tara:strand:+ start:9823 stop:9975 length:153 start_codon:yes stop_codon:yes gene_type:complete